MLLLSVAAVVIVVVARCCRLCSDLLLLHTYPGVAGCCGTYTHVHFFFVVLIPCRLRFTCCHSTDISTLRRRATSNTPLFYRPNGEPNRLNPTHNYNQGRSNTFCSVPSAVSFFPKAAQLNRFWSRHHSNHVRLCFLGEATSFSSVSLLVFVFRSFSASHRIALDFVALHSPSPPCLLPALSYPSNSPNSFLLGSFVLYLGLCSHTAERVPLSRGYPLSYSARAERPRQKPFHDLRHSPYPCPSHQAKYFDASRLFQGSSCPGSSLPFTRYLAVTFDPQFNCLALPALCTNTSLIYRRLQRVHGESGLPIKWSLITYSHPLPAAGVLLFQITRQPLIISLPVPFVPRPAIWQ